MADGVDHLLREYKHLKTNTGEFGTWTPTAERTTGSALDVSVVVAASDAQPSIKAAADYVCDGVADEVEINAAQDYLQALSGIDGGVIVLTEGNYRLDGPINIYGPNSIRGAGQESTALFTTSNVTDEVAPLYLSSTWSYCTDLSVRVNHDGYDYAVYASGNSGQYGHIARVTGHMNAPTASGYYGAFGIGSYVQADHLYVPTSNHGDGIIYNGSYDAKITNCRLMGADGNANGNGAGIILKNVSGTFGRDVIVMGNWISGSTSYDIYVTADDCIVVGNHVQESGITITSDASGTVVGLNLGTVTDNGVNTESVTSQASPLTTKGDLWGYDTADNRIPVGADGTVLVADSAQALGLKWDPQAGLETEVWGLPGTVTTGEGASRLYAPVAMTLVDFRISLSAGTATVDVNKDGTTVFTTQANRPAISSGTVSSLAVPDVTSVAADSYLTIDVDAASSAEDLIVTMRWRKT